MNAIREKKTYIIARICNIVCGCIELQLQGAILATSDAISFSSIKGDACKIVDTIQFSTINFYMSNVTKKKIAFHTEQLTRFLY